METSHQPESSAAATDLRRRGSPPWGVEAWLLVSALVIASGWLLSAIHQLNARGYICVLVVLALAAFWWAKSRRIWEAGIPRLRRTVRRARRPMPLGFFVLAALALAGGLLYTPGNYDALAYRLPRVLHWLAHGQWHWVQTGFPRVNVRACGQEWLIAPIIALTEGEHWTFVPSFISFLLLPGLFYSVFIRAGIKPRVAWPWMWICATGYCYVTQAGGLANDVIGATYALAAFDFALRVRQSGRCENLWCFFLSAALMTGAKASNVPLLLPLFLLVCPRWPLLLTKPAANFFVALLAALASFLPTAILNQINCHDWTGMRLEGPMLPYPMQLGINSVNLVLLNLAPPIFPLASHWAHFLRSTMGFGPMLLLCWSLPEMVEEGGAGLGLGVCLLLLLSFLATCVIRRRAGGPRVNKALPWSWKIILWSPYFCLLVFCVKAQTVNSVSRLITPYWGALIIPLLLFGCDESVVRQVWWRRFAGAVFVVAVGLVIVQPGRPLWPAQTILGRLRQSRPDSSLVVRAQAVYAVYARRPEAFAPLVAALPKDANLFGMLTFDEPETSLWWPLGSRRIEHVTPNEGPEDLRRRGIKYVLAPGYSRYFELPVENLIQKYHAEVFDKVPLILRVDTGTVDWYILRIPSS